MRWNDEYGQSLTRHEPMLNRIDMDVIDMTSEIVLIPDRMLPKTPLPDTAFTLRGAAG